MLRNSASWPEIGLPGRILVELLPGKHRNRPSGRHAFPVAVRPKSGPEGRFPARKHYGVTQSTSVSAIWASPGSTPKLAPTRRCCMSEWPLAGPKPYYSMLRNSASGPEIGLPGRILAGLLPGKNRNRLSGRPKAGRRADFGGFLVAVQQNSGPEVRFTARKHYCVT